MQVFVGSNKFAGLKPVPLPAQMAWKLRPCVAQRGHKEVEEGEQQSGVAQSAFAYSECSKERQGELGSFTTAQNAVVSKFR